MNEQRFLSIYNGLPSIGKKVYDAIPADAYWSLSRLTNELARSGVSYDPSKTLGVVNSLIKFGIVKEAQNGLFCRDKISRRTKTESSPTTYFDKTIKEETKMINEKTNPFDAVREVAIKFLDVAKTINALASEIDLRLADVEKHMATNDQDTAKLKQLQVLLKSLG